MLACNVLHLFILFILALVQLMIATNPCIPLTAGISSAALFVTLVIVIITFGLGFSCGTNHIKKNLTLTKKAKDEQEIPVYEEVGPTKGVQVQQNIAYGEVCKL